MSAAVWRVVTVDRLGVERAMTWIDPECRSEADFLSFVKEFFPGRRVEVERPIKTGDGFGTIDWAGGKAVSADH